jgi:hypothetical protein
MVKKTQGECTLSTPVLFLTFNRFDTTKRVFAEIRKAKPRELFIASDGPRKNKEGEEQLVREIRQYVLSNIDWNCNVKTLFREKNLGCKYAVSGAIDWFFTNVDQGIILEDDCLPNQSFFKFCQKMLEVYKNNKRIMHISGTNIMEESAGNDYFFSQLYNVWGWATWRRAWRYYDVDVKSWPKFRKSGGMKKFSIDLLDNIENTVGMEKLYRGETNTWDYQWAFCCILHNGLSIIPKYNLITNIGFGGGGTHTNDFVKNMTLKRKPLKFPLRINNNVVSSKQYRVSARKFFGKGRIKRFLKRTLRKIFVL